MVAPEDSSVPSSQASRAHTVRALQQQLQTWAGRSPSGDASRLIPSGCRALDEFLPAGGFLRGTLVEWFSADRGSGAAALALAVACQACHAGGVLVVVDPQGWFYPPALAAWDFSWRQLIVLRPTTPRDHLWAVDQALRCPAVAAVWTELEQLKARDFRRLQLAAEQGGGLGMLLRPLRAQDQPSWSELQLLVRPVPRQGLWGLRIECLRTRGAAQPQMLQLELDGLRGAIRPLRRLPEPASPQAMSRVL